MRPERRISCFIVKDGNDGCSGCADRRRLKRVPQAVADLLAWVFAVAKVRSNCLSGSKIGYCPQNFAAITKDISVEYSLERSFVGSDPLADWLDLAVSIAADGRHERC